MAGTYTCVFSVIQLGRDERQQAVKSLGVVAKSNLQWLCLLLALSVGSASHFMCNHAATWLLQTFKSSSAMVSRY